MARTTIEDCLEEDGNHFDLAFNVARRARDINKRGNAQVHENDDKAIVLALREIAEKRK